MRSGGLAGLAAVLALIAPPAGVCAGDTLRLSGTGSALGTMRQLCAAYEKGADARCAILPSVGSGGAFNAVARGALDVGLAARPLGPEERSLGIVAFEYARTPFLLAVGPRAGITGISAADAVRIYRGELMKWPNGERVRLVLRPRGDADTALLRAISGEMDAAVELAFAREGILTASTNQECHDLLARTPGSIGPSSLTQIATEGLRIVPLSWNGVAPTAENLASGDYPLVKRLYLVVHAPLSPAVRRFVAFLAGPEGQRLIAGAGNLPTPLPPLD